ncbi:MAG: hypothetical protein ABI665_06175 [Vicinamibacterales bacterium]
MNEYIEVSFRKPNGTRLRVKRQLPGGIEFDEPDAIERTVGLQINGRGEATRQRMRRIAQVKGWDPGQFKLTAGVEDGNVLLRGVDQDALPEGLYSLKVLVEEATTSQATKNLTVDQDGHDSLAVTVAMDERDIAVDLQGCDPDVARILDSSSIDGLAGVEWLQSDHRAVRRACWLNLLASLRVRPKVSDPLIDLVDNTFMVFNDRAYMKVGRGLLPRIDELVKDPAQPFYAEGAPTASIHARLLEQIPEPADIKSRFQGLLSFRGEGSPSLQMVIAVPPIDLPYTYAEFDLDQANPLQDLTGFVVHMGELLGGKQTNHLDLRKKLVAKAGDYLYYTVIAA